MLLQASGVHGRGLFASKEFASPENFIPVPLVGSFEVHDSLDDCLEVAKKSGIPRFRVCDNTFPFLSKSEVARPFSGLYLVPDRTCPLFYMNSARDDEVQNFTARTILKPSRDFRGGEIDIKDFLRDAKNSLCFSINCRVPKGTELLTFYELGEDSEKSSEDHGESSKDHEENVLPLIFGMDIS